MMSNCCFKTLLPYRSRFDRVCLLAYPSDTHVRMAFTSASRAAITCNTKRSVKAEPRISSSDGGPEYLWAHRGRIIRVAKHQIQVVCSLADQSNSQLPRRKISPE